MTLDVLALSGPVRAMSAAVRDTLQRLPDRLARARELLAAEAADWDFWGEEVARASSWGEEVAWSSSRSPFLLAQPLEPMDAVYDAPPCPAAYAVAAADGSQIDVDHHGQAVCYVVNVGTAAITYGPAATFSATTRPTLGYLPHELMIEDPKTGREYPMEGKTLDAERDMREGIALAEIAQNSSWQSATASSPGRHADPLAASQP